MKDKVAHGFMSRRGFLRLSLGFGTLLIGCRPADEVPPPSPGAGVTATVRAWRWEIRWIRGTPPRPPADGEGAWRLMVDGMVKLPVALSLADLRNLPVSEQRSRMKCVECWSAPALWRGVRGRDLTRLVEPLAGADYLTMHSADGYDTTCALIDIDDERTLFAYDMDGSPLPDGHGFPLRLILPAHYGYKGAKAITRLEFTDQHKRGFWENRGYDNEGLVQAGTDHPLDLEGSREIGPGEITDY